MTIPSLVSLRDELDLDFGFADLGLSFLLSGEEERLTERVKTEETEEKAVPVSKSLDANIGSGKVQTEHRKGGIMV